MTTNGIWKWETIRFRNQEKCNSCLVIVNNENLSKSAITNERQGPLESENQEQETLAYY